MLEARDRIAQGCLSGEYGSAEQRAAVLLLAHLTPRQRRSYLRSGGFVVRGSGGRRYHMVNWVTTVRWLVLWPLPFYLSGCIHPYGLAEYHYGVDMTGIPIADRLLALKLLAETDQDRFHDTANW